MMTRYTYLGDRLSDPSLRGTPYDPVKRVDGKVVVVLRRRLRLGGHPAGARER